MIQCSTSSVMYLQSVWYGSQHGSIPSCRWYKGKRFALPNAEIMIHQPSGGAQGQATEIQIVAEHDSENQKEIERDSGSKYRTAAMK